MKSHEEIMEILEAYDLTQSLRAAADLAGCDHHTVARYVALRDQGEVPTGVRRARLADPYLPKIEEWVERSEAKVRADVVHRRLVVLGYEGSPRTTRRAVAEVKENWQRGHRRTYRPWVPEPGLWLQWDWAQGPLVEGRETCLYCAWLAWSRYRVVIPTWDRTLPTLVACLDRTFRILGGAPTYALTDNEKTVTTDVVAGLPVRNPTLVEAARHYGVTVAPCAPADPETKGGVEATVRIAKADLLPAAVNLGGAYRSFPELEAACQLAQDEWNDRPHALTRTKPAEALVSERRHLHRIPDHPHALALGETRRVAKDATITFGGARYSVPSDLVGETVWVRRSGAEVVAVATAEGGATEVARHPEASRGGLRVDPTHYPPPPPGPLGREPRAQTPDEEAFLSLGEGARTWLREAAQAGVRRIRRKMAAAVALARLYGTEPVDRALGEAAVAGRFRDGDTEAILRHQMTARSGEHHRATEDRSLQAPTRAWEGFGR